MQGYSIADGLYMAVLKQTSDSRFGSNALKRSGVESASYLRFIVCGKRGCVGLQRASMIRKADERRSCPPRIMAPAN